MGPNPIPEHWIICKNELMDVQPGAWFLKAVHTAGAQNKSYFRKLHVLSKTHIWKKWRLHAEHQLNLVAFLMSGYPTVTCINYF